MITNRFLLWLESKAADGSLDNTIKSVAKASEQLVDELDAAKKIEDKKEREAAYSKALSKKSLMIGAAGLGGAVALIAGGSAGGFAALAAIIIFISFMSVLIEDSVGPEAKTALDKIKAAAEKIEGDPEAADNELVKQQLENNEELKAYKEAYLSLDLRKFITEKELLTMSPQGVEALNTFARPMPATSAVAIASDRIENQLKTQTDSRKLTEEDVRVLKKVVAGVLVETLTKNGDKFKDISATQVEMKIFEKLSEFRPELGELKELVINAKKSKTNPPSEALKKIGREKVAALVRAAVAKEDAKKSETEPAKSEKAEEEDEETKRDKEARETAAKASRRPAGGMNLGGITKGNPTEKSAEKPAKKTTKKPAEKTTKKPEVQPEPDETTAEDEMMQRATEQFIKMAINEKIEIDRKTTIGDMPGKDEKKNHPQYGQLWEMVYSRGKASRAAYIALARISGKYDKLLGSQYEHYSHVARDPIYLAARIRALTAKKD